MIHRPRYVMSSTNFDLISFLVGLRQFLGLGLDSSFGSLYFLQSTVLIGVPFLYLMTALLVFYENGTMMKQSTCTLYHNNFS
jgi:hypothetical protein